MGERLAGLGITGGGIVQLAGTAVEVEKASTDIRAAVAGGIMDALQAIAFGLSLTPDERLAIENHRAQQVAEHEANLHGARAVIDAALHRNCG